jgi:rubrerythrin
MPVLRSGPAWRDALGMSDKPTYLGLLNAIAIAEGRAHSYLCAWAERTPNADVRRVLLTVAAREGEHAASFAKRINELGYEVRHKDGGETDKALEIVTSDRSDLEKMKALKLHRLDTRDGPDIFDNFFADHSIDVRTGELLGRYIAEERDTGSLLRSCYEQLKTAAKDDRLPEADDRLSRLEGKLDALCSAVDELWRAIRADAVTR